MRSSFGTTLRKVMATSTNQIDETYDLRGINLITPDQIMPKGESPWTINSRMYAREDSDSRVANRTRRGSTTLSAPIGRTANVQNIAAATGSDTLFSNEVTVAQPFIANASGLLTELQLDVKKVVDATGHVIVEIRTDISSLPGTLIAQSSIKSSDIGTSYAYHPAYFIDAPALVDGTKYWMVVYTQDNGGGTYGLNQTATAGALQLVQVDDSVSWTVLGTTFHHKTFTSTAGGVKGFGTRYPSNNANYILMAHGTSIYTVDKTTSATTSIDSGLDSTATYTRFLQIDDMSYWVNGKNHIRYWDGTNPAADVPGITSTPTNAMLYANRLFVMTGKTRVDFTELSDFDNWPSDNFFYVPTALSPDPMTAWCEFKGDMWIYTYESKHRITGTSISTFTRKELKGTKGCVSQEALAVDNDYMYFMADDGQIYRSNGIGDDELLSDKVQPELNSNGNLTGTRLHLYRNQLRVYYTRVPAVAPNRMLLYDIPNKQWFLDTGRLVTGSMELSLDNNELVEFSSLAGWVFNGETGGSDLGKRIDWKYWTPYKTYGSGSAKKRIKKFRPIIRTVDADYTMLVGKDMDFNNTPDMREYIVRGGGAKWGAFVWGDGTKWGSTKLIDGPSAMSGRGKHIQYRFERSGVDTPVEQYGYISQYKMGRPK